MIERFPTLRFEFEASKLSLLRALDDRNSEVQEMITRSFENALVQMQGQLDAQVRTVLNRIFQEAIDSAAESVKENLADELAAAMAKNVEAIVRKHMK